MEQNNITFSGNNEKLFSKIHLETIGPKLTLIVPETHNAILVKDGQMLQTLSSGKYLLWKFIDPKEDEDSTFEVLFMSKTAKLKMRWGTPQKLLMFDPVLQENYSAGFSGDFEVQIGDPRKSFLYLVGAEDDLTADKLQERLQSNVVSVMEEVLTKYIEENNVSYKQLSQIKKEVSQKVLNALSHKLLNEYGIAVFSFNIANIILDTENLNKTKKDDLKTCVKCGAVLKESDKFCSNCGQKVGGGKRCQKCGTENFDDSKFCSSCGERL